MCICLQAHSGGIPSWFRLCVSGGLIYRGGVVDRFIGRRGRGVEGAGRGGDEMGY